MSKKYKFETLQLHVGQEVAELMPAQFRFIKLRRMFFIISTMRRTDSDFATQEIFMDV